MRNRIRLAGTCFCKSSNFCRNNSKAIVLDTYYYTDWNAQVSADAKSTDYYDMRSGKLCYELNAGRTDGKQAWFQTLDEDSHPVPDNIHPSALGAYNLALGVWSYLRHIPCWELSVPGTVTAPTLDGTQWANKKWYAYGTSITAGIVSSDSIRYAYYVKQMSGMTLTNKGVSGGALVTNRNIFDALCDSTDGKLEADLITIEVGANDGGELGNPWSLDTKQFYGALNYCIRKMFADGIRAQVVIMASTPGRFSSTDSTDVFGVNKLYHT